MLCYWVMVKNGGGRAVIGKLPEFRWLQEFIKRLIGADESAIPMNRLTSGLNVF